MKRYIIRSIQLILLVFLIAGVIWGINQIGVERIRASVEQFGIWAPLVLLLLRFVSIVLPVLPGTLYSILAGGLLGFWVGLLTMAIADLLACTFNFYIAKRYGREFVQKLVGQKFMNRVDRFSQKHLERNFFLMTGFLMTGVFDFVCYGVGLTQTSWKWFMSALIVSIAIAKPPLIAVGAGVFEGGQMLLGFALLGTFILAMITGWLNRKQTT